MPDPSTSRSLPDRRISQAEGWRKIAVADAKAWKARAETAEADVARLRTALEKIAYPPEFIQSRSFLSAWAREALNGGTND